MDVGDLSHAPFAVPKGFGGMLQLHSFSYVLKNALSEVAKTQGAAYLSLYELFEDIRLDPRKYGFNPEKINERCLVPAVGDTPRVLCDKPDSYMWFDADHVCHILSAS